MTLNDFRQLRTGDIVYVHFSRNYRQAVVTMLEVGHVCVQGAAVRGGKLTKRVKYQSVDTQATGRHKQGMSSLGAAKLLADADGSIA